MQSEPDRTSTQTTAGTQRRQRTGTPRQSAAPRTSVADSLRENTAEAVQRLAETLHSGTAGAARGNAGGYRTFSGTASGAARSGPAFSRQPTGGQPFSQGSFVQQQNASAQQGGWRSIYTAPTGQTYRAFYAESTWARGSLGIVRSIKRCAAWLLGVAGIGGCAFFGAFTLIAFAMSFGEPSMFSGTLAFFIFTIIAGAAGWFGIRSSRRMQRFNTYLSVLGEQECCRVDALAAAAQRPRAFVTEDLRTMIRLGYFRAAYLNPKGTVLYESADAYRKYEGGEATAPVTPQPAEPQLTKREVLAEECSTFMAQLQAEKAHIDEPAVLEQVEQVEQHTQRIFTWVKTHPNSSNAVQRFTDYYLPTTLKLLRTYNEVDPQAENGGVAGQIQHDIVGILYTINKAYANLEDGLLQDTALDVASEISALETVLAQEGLTKGELDLK